MPETIDLGGVRCMLYTRGSGGDVVVTPCSADGSGFARVCALTAQGTDRGFSLAGVAVDDWNAELSPWKAPAVFGNKDFAGGGERLLSRITEVCLPYFKARLCFDASSKLYIGGYSLAGLFSLWAFCRTGLFDGFASCSGSLWFPGLGDFLAVQSAKPGSRAYLSLGDREEKTRVKAFKSIGDDTRRLYERLRADESFSAVALEWNIGDHFEAVDERTAKGFAWLINGCCSQG